MATRKSAKPRKGRPAGSTNGEHVVVDVVPAHCPRCDSTQREVLRIVRERELPGTSPAGEDRTHIVWRRVRCRACAGIYIEASHENRLA